MEEQPMLSQDELNLLLKESQPVVELTADQRDALLEIGEVSFGIAFTALASLVRQTVKLDRPTIFLTSQREIKEQYPLRHLLLEIGYKQVPGGTSILLIKNEDVALIADLIGGGPGLSPKQNLGEYELNAITKALNQVVGNVAVSLTTLFDRRMEVIPHRIELIDLQNEETVIAKDRTLTEPMVVLLFKLRLGTMLESELKLLTPYPVALELTQRLSHHAEAPGLAPVLTKTAPVSQAGPDLSGIEAEDLGLESETVVPSPPGSALELTSAPVQPITATAMPAEQPILDEAAPVPEPPVSSPVILEQAAATVAAVTPEPAPLELEQAVAAAVPAEPTVTPAQFGQLEPVKTGKEPPGNVGLLLDVPLQITVELGNTRMKIKNVLELGLGSVVELDKLAGDPVDLFVNGRLIAKGQVVVCDQNFGIKIIDIISPIERANTLQ